jgi:hypothetical protein
METFSLDLDTIQKLTEDYTYTTLKITDPHGTFEIRWKETKHDDHLIDLYCQIYYPLYTTYEKYSVLFNRINPVVNDYTIVIDDESANFRYICTCLDNAPHLKDYFANYYAFILGSSNLFCNNESVDMDELKSLPYLTITVLYLSGTIQTVYNPSYDEPTCLIKYIAITYRRSIGVVYNGDLIYFNDLPKSLACFPQIEYTLRKKIHTWPRPNQKQLLRTHLAFRKRGISFYAEFTLMHYACMTIYGYAHKHLDLTNRMSHNELVEQLDTEQVNLIKEYYMNRNKTTFNQIKEDLKGITYTYNLQTDELHNNNFSSDTVLVRHTGPYHPNENRIGYEHYRYSRLDIINFIKNINKCIVYTLDPLKKLKFVWLSSYYNTVQCMIAETEYKQSTDLERLCTRDNYQYTYPRLDFICQPAWCSFDFDMFMTNGEIDLDATFARNYFYSQVKKIMTGYENYDMMTKVENIPLHLTFTTLCEFNQKDLELLFNYKNI